MNAKKTKQEQHTFENVWQMFQETDQRFKETSRQIEDLSKSSKETDRRLDTVAKMVGGISNNMGDAAEDFFFNGLSATLSIGDIKYDYIQRKAIRLTKKMENEFDILLVNSNSVVVVEINYKVHPDEVDKMINKKIPAFKALFPEYKSYTIYGAVAGLALTSKTISLAKENGLFILTQSGENVKVVNERGFKPKGY